MPAVYLGPRSCLGPQTRRLGWLAIPLRYVLGRMSVPGVLGGRGTQEEHGRISTGQTVFSPTTGCNVKFNFSAFSHR